MRATPAGRGRTIPVFAIADEYRARHGWDLVVLITDLPRRSGAQSIVGGFSTAHHVPLASLPALGGGLGLHGRLRALLVHLLGHLTKDRLGTNPHVRGTPCTGASRAARRTGARPGS